MTDADRATAYAIASAWLKAATIEPLPLHAYAITTRDFTAIVDAGDWPRIAIASGLDVNGLGIQARLDRNAEWQFMTNSAYTEPQRDHIVLAAALDRWIDVVANRQDARQ